MRKALARILAITLLVSVLLGGASLRPVHAQALETCADVKAYIFEVDSRRSPRLVESIVCDDESRQAIVTLTDVAYAVQSYRPATYENFTDSLRHIFGTVGYGVDVRRIGTGAATTPRGPVSASTLAFQQFFVRDGVGIGSVSAGQTLQDAILAWGQPDRQTSGDDPGVMMYVWYRHPGEVDAIVRDDRITMLFADGNSQFRTQSGLVVLQSTMSDVRARLGAPEETKVRESGRITWYYWHRGIHVVFDHGMIDYVAVFEPD